MFWAGCQHRDCSVTYFVQTLQPWYVLTDSQWHWQPIIMHFTDNAIMTKCYNIAEVMDIVDGSAKTISKLISGLNWMLIQNKLWSQLSIHKDGLPFSIWIKIFGIFFQFLQNTQKHLKDIGKWNVTLLDFLTLYRVTHQINNWMIDNILAILFARLSDCRANFSKNEKYETCFHLVTFENWLLLPIWHCITVCISELVTVGHTTPKRVNHCEETVTCIFSL